MIIGIDLDGVCRDFKGAVDKTFTQVYPELASQIKPQTTYSFEHWPFDKAGVDGWDFMHEYAKEIFALAEPIPGVIEAVSEIVRNLEPKGHQIIVVSHQDPEIMHYSWLWLYLNEFPVSNAKFVPEAQQKWKYVDLMIDDSPHVLAAKPQGKYSVKVNQTYNADSQSDWSVQHVREFLPIFEAKFR